jgi:hypothetical protein
MKTRRCIRKFRCKYSSLKHRSKKTIRRYKRKAQKGGWGGFNPPTISTNKNKEETIMFGGWGSLIV